MILRNVILIFALFLGFLLYELNFLYQYPFEVILRETIIDILNKGILVVFILLIMNILWRFENRIKLKYAMFINFVPLVSFIVYAVFLSVDKLVIFVGLMTSFLLLLFTKYLTKTKIKSK